MLVKRQSFMNGHPRSLWLTLDYARYFDEPIFNIQFNKRGGIDHRSLYVKPWISMLASNPVKVFLRGNLIAVRLFWEGGQKKKFWSICSSCGRLKLFSSWFALWLLVIFLEKGNTNTSTLWVVDCRLFHFDLCHSCCWTDSSSLMNHFDGNIFRWNFQTLGRQRQ